MVSRPLDESRVQLTCGQAQTTREYGGVDRGRSVSIFSIQNGQHFNVPRVWKEIVGLDVLE